jgi:UDPglucose 6-dehydrogenase/GDP-mannose 6-dehydrogenase
MRVAILGAGYVGLVSGVCLAARGHEVVCVDLDPSIVDSLNKGKPTLYEAKLEALLGDVVRRGMFQATVALQAALEDADGVIIAVGTPSRAGEIDLSHVRQAARQIGAFLKTRDRFLPIIVKSTIVPGTTDTVLRQEIEEASGKKHGAFGLGMNPEFLREGNAVSDFMDPDRIVLGHEDAQTLAFLEALYASWDCDKLRVNTRTAELIKYAGNFLLAAQISATNELANLAASLGGIDIMEVMRGVHLDKRWNPLLDGKRVEPEILTYLIPGCGFGGSCFPKDVQALCAEGKKRGLPMAMVEAVLAVNERQPLEVVSVLERAAGDLKGLRCLILGLAFKPGTDDVRETASLPVVRGLLDRGAHVTLHDPVAAANFKKLLGAREAEVGFCADWEEFVAAADVVIVTTKWPDYQKLAAMNLAGKIVLDPRRFFDPAALFGARYLSIGRRV